MLTLLSGDQMLVMRGGKMESQEETEAGPLWQHRQKLPMPACCRTLVIPDTARDARFGTAPLCGRHALLRVVAVFAARVCAH